MGVSRRQAVASDPPAARVDAIATLWFPLALTLCSVARDGPVRASITWSTSARAVPGAALGGGSAGW
jgi:hypothetical protein